VDIREASADGNAAQEVETQPLQVQTSPAM